MSEYDMEDMSSNTEEGSGDIVRSNSRSRNILIFGGDHTVATKQDHDETNGTDKPTIGGKIVHNPDLLAALGLHPASLDAGMGVVDATDNREGLPVCTPRAYAHVV